MSRDKTSRDVLRHAYLHMEEHVEEITSYCQEYVIGGSDKEPVKLLAKGNGDNIMVGIN